MSASQDLVVPSAIPWKEMVGDALEEFLYWLCDAMGAKDLAWRAGSASGQSTDGGRDIEATFYPVGPDGEPRSERWWLQAKGRTRTLERSAVEEAVIHCQAEPGLDVVVIATNSRFTNPTRDWVKAWSEMHAHPRVLLWDREALERMAVRHPEVVARVAPGALSDAGRLASVVSRFWNHAEYALERDLAHLWAHREALAIGDRQLVALVASEAANGDLGLRPWASALDAEQTLELLILSLVNSLPFAYRAGISGSPTHPAIVGLSYIVQLALRQLQADDVGAVLRNPWAFVESPPLTEQKHVEIAARFITEPVLRQLREELGVACAADCSRMYLDPIDDHEKPTDHFDRFSSDGRPPGRYDDRRLVMEKLDEPCVMGVLIGEGEDARCPFGGDDVPGTVELAAFKRVIEQRLAQRDAAVEAETS